VHVAEVVIHGKTLGKPLNRRKRVTVELPEFLVRAIDARVDEANQNEPAEHELTFNDVVEWLRVSEVTIRRMPLLEVTIPASTTQPSIACPITTASRS
jgi:hypothetical protein